MDFKESLQYIIYNVILFYKLYVERKGIGVNSELDNTEVIQPNGDSWVQSNFSKHWVTITEMTVDEIQDNIVYKVSTWGGYAYLDLDSFIDGEYIYECLMYFE